MIFLIGFSAGSKAVPPRTRPNLDSNSLCGNRRGERSQRCHNYLKLEESVYRSLSAFLTSRLLGRALHCFLSRFTRPCASHRRRQVRVTPPAACAAHLVHSFLVQLT